MEELAKLVGNLGFPIAVSVWLLWWIPTLRDTLTKIGDRLDAMAAKMDEHNRLEEQILEEVRRRPQPPLAR